MLAIAERTERTLLEIDDEPEDTILNDRYLNELRARRQTAEDLDEAKESFRVLGPMQEFDSNNIVIVLDLMFPDDYLPERGIEFIYEIRAGKFEIHRNTPIVVLSNSRSPEVEANARRAGANEFFVKTTDPRELIDRLAYYLGKEEVEASAVCEVMAVQSEEQNIRIRMRGTGDWVAERSVALDLCPPLARVAGGSFYLDTFRRFRAYRTEFVIRSRSVDIDEEMSILKGILGEG